VSRKSYCRNWSHFLSDFALQRVFHNALKDEGLPERGLLDQKATANGDPLNLQWKPKNLDGMLACTWIASADDGFVIQCTQMGSFSDSLSSRMPLGLRSLHQHERITERLSLAASQIY
jgi:hypothetical protein